MAYAHPPITEAVLDLRVQELQVEVSVLMHLIKEFQEFDEIKTLQHLTGELELNLENKTGKGHASREILGFAALNSEKTRVLQIQKNGLSLSHLAPYQGWESLETEARHYWTRFQEVFSPKVVRVATRYINRFDLPCSTRLDFADYFETIPRIPKSLDTGLAGFFMQLRLPQPDLGATVIINQAMAQPPSPQISSLVLDIDLFVDKAVPQKDEAIWAKFREMRARKNKIFEDCLTEAAREVIR